MKRVTILLLAVVCMAVFSGCICFHEWADADCVNPQTCLSCEKTKGEALGHDWQNADCNTPKTCSRCGETEGEALDHDWQDATTEAPRTCALCGLTEGERIVTDPRFTTAACQDLFGTWSCTVEMDGETLGLKNYSESISCVCTYVFCNDGTMTIHMTPVDMDLFMEQVTDYYMALMYDNFAATGISRDEADEAIQSIYGVTLEEFIAAVLEEENVGASFDAPVSLVYYVKDGTVFMAGDWESEMRGSALTMIGDTVTIGDTLHDTKVITLTRVQ